MNDKEIYYLIWNSVRNSVEVSVKNSVLYSVGNSVWDSVMGSVEDSVGVSRNLINNKLQSYNYE